jgi:hypothetical protein
LANANSASAHHIVPAIVSLKPARPPPYSEFVSEMRSGRRAARPTPESHWNLLKPKSCRFCSSRPRASIVSLFT